MPNSALLLPLSPKPNKDCRQRSDERLFAWKLWYTVSQISKSESKRR